MLKQAIESVFILFFLFTGHVYAACQVSATPVNFGNYDVFSIAPLDTTGNVTISCPGSPDTSVEIALEAGENGPIANRMMRQLNGQDKLKYNIYINAGRTTIWGNGTGNSLSQTITTNGSSPFTLTAYGRIPPQQDVSVGVYSDTVTITISF